MNDRSWLGSVYDIAVVGGGFSGVMVAVNAAQRAARPLRIAIVERKDEFGRGVAYAATPRDAVLNVPAGAMGAFPDQPDDFVNWLRSLNPRAAAAIDPTAYYPRELYGSYLGSLLGDAERAGHDITCISAQVVDFERRADRIDLIAADGICVAGGRQVVFALGAPPPADIIPGLGTLRDHPRYVRDPWIFLKRKNFDAQGRILIVGSGLTALDVIAAFAKNGYSNQLVVVSRGGRFPQPHAAQPAPPVNPIPDGCKPSTIRDVMRHVRVALRRTTEGGGDWRSVIDGLRPQIAELWLRFDPVEQRRFLRHVRSVYDPHRHRAPATVLAVKERLCATGQLHTIAGRITSLTSTPEAIAATIRRRSDGCEQIVEAAQIINCGGPGNLSAASSEPLVARLFERGAVIADAAGLGVRALRDGRLIDAGGRAQPDLYAIGWPMRGVLLETTAVRELRAQARLLADELIRSLPAELPHYSFGGTSSR